MQEEAIEMRSEVISVIVPVYNVEQYLPDCLESILRQTYPNLEIIVINDGSTDGSTEIIKRYAEVDCRIKVMEQRNKGQSSARNVGMKAATGAYIAFVDSDDRIEADMLEQMLVRIQSSGADIVECGYNELFADGSLSRCVPYPKNYDEIVGTDKILENHVKGRISLLVWNKLYRAEKVKTIAFTEGKKYEDILWSVEALMNIQKICSVRECLYNWRQRSGSTTNSAPTMNRLTALEHFDQRIDMLTDYPQAALVARERILCECYLECKTMRSTGDTALIGAVKHHSMNYFMRHKLSICEIVCLHSLSEIIRYFYYLLKFLGVQIQLAYFTPHSKT